MKVWHYARQLRGAIDLPELALVAPIVRPGDSVVDVGANFGLITKALADLVGPSGRVLAVEPMPETYYALARNVEALGLTQVRPVHAALSDRTGTGHMALPDDNYYLACVADEGVAVPMTTLDALTEGLGPVAFVKCDVEGHEVAVLRGARRLLATDLPAWLIEVWSGETFDIMAGYGYRAYAETDGDVRPWRDGDDRANVLFCHPSRHELAGRGLVHATRPNSP